MIDPKERHQVKIAGYLASRERALAQGDVNLARAITMDLRRMGYTEPETTSAPVASETATPPRARRPRKVA